MELWIRSQNRKLLEKAEMVKIAHYHIESIKEEDFTYSIVVNNDYTFGDYKTEERALEVLDEIQSRIINIQTYNLLISNVCDIKGKEEDYAKLLIKYVYEMPKE